MHYLDHVLRTQSVLKSQWKTLWQVASQPPDAAALAKLIQCDPQTIETALTLSRLSAYQVRLIAKRTTGQRLLLAPEPPLKYAQRLLMRWLDVTFRAHPASHGFLVGRSTVSNALVHTGAAWLVSVDIEQFFYSTTHLHLIRALQRRQKVWPPGALEALVRLATVDVPSLGFSKPLTRNVKEALRLAPHLQNWWIAQHGEDSWAAFRDIASLHPPKSALLLAQQIHRLNQKQTRQLRQRMMDARASALGNHVCTNLRAFILGWMTLHSPGPGREGNLPSFRQAVTFARKLLEDTEPSPLPVRLFEKSGTETRFTGERTVPWPDPASALSTMSVQQLGWSGTPQRLVSIAPETLGWRVLPQGSPCSPVLSNIVLHELDDACQALAQRLNGQYSRYADDLTFSFSSRPTRRFVGEVARLLERHGYRLNRHKTKWRGQHQRQLVNGLVVNAAPGAPPVRLQKSYLRKVRAMLHRLDRGLPIWWSPEERARVEAGKQTVPEQARVIAQLRGHLAYIQMVSPKTHRHLLARSTWASSASSSNASSANKA